MLEHEAKILNIDSKMIQAKLDRLGAKKILDGITYIEGYDFDPESKVKTKHIPQRFRLIMGHVNGLRTFPDMFSQGAYLRLRQEGKRFELIYKQKIKSSKEVKSEVEISVPIKEDEWESTAEMLTGLGLKKIVVQEKQRISYIYPPFRYDIDTWPEVPTYLEVEAPSPMGVLQAIGLLGLMREVAVSMSAAEVFNMYGIKNPRYLTFRKKL